MKLLLLLTLPCTAAAYSNGITELLTGAFKPKTELKDFSKAFGGTTLDLTLEIGENKNMAVSNLQVELTKNMRDKTKKAGSSKRFLPMPGFDGPHSGQSGGVSDVTIVKPGQFIDLSGLNHLKLADHASWEITWRQDSPAGALICALELLEPAVRNSAKLDAGLVYVTFPVWTQSTLTQYQSHKATCEEAVAALVRERDEALQKFQSTDNILAKALHYRDAAAAMEKHSLQPIGRLSKVPSDDEVLPIADNLVLAQAGTIWTKQSGSILGSPMQTFKGTAFISKPADVAAEAAAELAAAFAAAKPKVAFDTFGRRIDNDVGVAVAVDKKLAP